MDHTLHLYIDGASTLSKVSAARYDVYDFLLVKGVCVGARMSHLLLLRMHMPASELSIGQV